ncbi:MAG: hypothetical protein Ct9H300mP27_00360 [Chloroflexota bacterium]|nr:MAG: hypothetical protein Ct9H300mP27_00360 [Chloroflexota bacterium]
MSAIASWTALLKVIVVKCHVTLFIVCIPILILSGAVTWAINDIGLYQKGFDKYHISTKTGISSDNLTDVSRQIQRYFNSTDEPLFVKTKIFGDERILFNDREATHMRDVKKLIHLVYSLMMISGIYIVGTIIWSRISGPTWPFYTRPLIIAYGGYLTILSVLSLGFLSLTGFDKVFVTFHEISFSNDLWILDPRTDYLIMLFPFGFWFDTTIKIGLISIVISTIATVASTGVQVVANVSNNRPNKS